MKTYSIQELKKISQEQGYKICSLENAQGEKIQPFNVPTKTTLVKHLDTITNRLKTDLYPDGLYYIVLNTYVANSKNSKKFPIVKGILNPEELKEQTKPVTTIIQQSHDVLSWESALKLHHELTELKSEVKRLEYENNLLQQQLEEMETESEGLNDAPGSNILSYLKETIPSLMPILDKHFELQERKLNLEELKINKGTYTPPQPKKKFTRVKIVPGTQNHLNLIEHYFSINNDTRLNEELDKLEEVSTELYLQVCEKLGINTDANES